MINFANMRQYFSHKLINTMTLNYQTLKLISNNDPSLTSLSLSFKRIGPNGAEQLAIAFKTNNKVKSIDLFDNDLGPGGAKHIAKIIETNKSVTAINLNFNHIGPDGLGYLVEALIKNKTVTSIELGNNDIGDTNCEKIVSLIKKNKTLKMINLSYNKIGEVVIRAIAKALEENTTITKIFIHQTDVSAKVLKKINNLIERNKKLESSTSESTEETSSTSSSESSDETSSTSSSESSDETSSSSSSESSDKTSSSSTSESSDDSTSQTNRNTPIAIPKDIPITLQKKRQNFIKTLQMGDKSKLDSLNLEANIDLMNERDIEGKSLGSYIAKTYDSETVLNYLSFVERMPTVQINKILSSLDKVNEHIGHYIAKYQTQDVQVYFIGLVIRFIPGRLPALLNGKNKSNETMLDLIQKYHKESLGAVIYQLLPYSQLIEINIKKYKPEVLSHIKTLPVGERINALEKSLDKSTLLGNYFSIKKDRFHRVLGNNKNLFNQIKKLLKQAYLAQDYFNDKHFIDQGVVTIYQNSSTFIPDEQESFDYTII